MDEAPITLTFYADDSPPWPPPPGPGFLRITRHDGSTEDVPLRSDGERVWLMAGLPNG